MTTQAQFKGCLLGMALGDAIGELAFTHAGRGDLDAAIDRALELTYTDDTAMGLALAEALLQSGDAECEAIGEAFSAAYAREPWRGYGPGPPRIFHAVAHEGMTYRQAARALYGGEGSLGNGAAMRVAPVGLLFADDADLYGKTKESAVATHAHPVGIDGAAVQAKAVAMASAHDPADALHTDDLLQALTAFARSDAMAGKLDEIGRCLHEALDPSRAIRRLGSSIAVDESLPFALYCFLRHPDDFSECLYCAAGHGGDRDTMAAMACAVSGARLGVEGIPAAWLERLENRDYIESLAQRLWEKNEPS